MKIVDINCLVGHWPFRKLYKNTFADLAEIHRGNGIEYGFVSSLNSIFYNDPFEGEEELHNIIKGTAYRHILTINPSLPYFAEDIRAGVELFNVSGVRIYPCYHDYMLNCEDMDRLCRILSEYNLPLFLTLRMEDERLNYIIKPQPVNLEDIRLFSVRNRNLKIILLNIRMGEITRLKELLIDQDNVYIDTSGLKDQLFSIEKLTATLGADKIIYGSEYPLFCLKSTLLEVVKAEIDENSKEKILFSNSERLYKLRNND